MCIYWRKGHLCGCASRFYVETCRPALLAHKTCEKVIEDLELRKSYFKCYDCLREEVRQEIRAANLAAEQAAAAVKRAQEDKKKVEELAREQARKDKIRKDAEERAQKERDEDAKRERDRKAEIERQRREGGLWVDASAGKKGKGRKSGGAGGGSGPGTPMAILTPKKGMGSPSPTPKAPTQALAAPQAPAGVDPGGRAGRWGPAKKVVKEGDRAVGWKK
ncbi:hypothetical protein K505DRAFT_69271 [Melanomma pulvis-pyrius CBS 109.77]|uniref:Uncharacterized protein n=1 Tax=Melanomma pulvis-pyrius CBS 109.77 TaxID=1314802 RepID=A0A6A6X4M2_9PLEO|nr:hypothetical protein K505DRAFT_69271 [Melanomma pulvis-pyrius CBS 109.77]